MKFLSKLFGGKSEKPSPPTEPKEPVRFSGSVEISVQEGLAAHFFRKDKKSWPGVLWAVKCACAGQQHTFLVRTYFTQSPANQAEKLSLAEKAKEYIASRIAHGPIPRDEEHILE